MLESMAADAFGVSHRKEQGRLSGPGASRSGSGMRDALSAGSSRPYRMESTGFLAHQPMYDTLPESVCQDRFRNFLRKGIEQARGFDETRYRLVDFHQ